METLALVCCCDRLAMSCVQFKDATKGLTLREKIHCEVAADDWSRPRSAQKLPRPQVINGTVCEEERLRLLAITDSARASLTGTDRSSVTASGSTRASHQATTTRDESEEAKWSDPDLKTPSPYTRPRNYLLTSDGLDDPEERFRPSKKKSRPARLTLQQIQEALLDSSDDEDPVRVVGGNGSKTMLAQQPPSSECETFIDDLKAGKKNHVPVLFRDDSRLESQCRPPQSSSGRLRE